MVGQRGRARSGSASSRRDQRHGDRHLRGVWSARRRGRHAAGVRRALGGAAVSGIGGYLGGHLAAARKVGSHDPAFNDDSPLRQTSYL